MLGYQSVNLLHHKYQDKSNHSAECCLGSRSFKLCSTLSWPVSKGGTTMTQWILTLFQPAVQLEEGSHELQAGGGVELMTSHTAQRQTHDGRLFGDHCRVNELRPHQHAVSDTQSVGQSVSESVRRCSLTCLFSSPVVSPQPDVWWCNLLPVKTPSLLLCAKPAPVAPSQTRRRAA